MSRAVQGVGGAIMFSVSLALLADSFRGKDRGDRVRDLGWRSSGSPSRSDRCSAAHSPPACRGGGSSSSTCRSGSSRSHHHDPGAGVEGSGARRPDWVGVVTFTLALASLVYGLIESSERGFCSTRVIVCLIAAGVLLVAFVIAEWLGKHPMFDLTLFKLPTFSGGLIAAFGISASIFSMLLYLTLYPSGHAALQPVPDRPAAADDFRRHPGRLDDRRPAHLARAGTVPDRSRPAIVGSLLLMRGLTASSEWTHLIPGFIVAGIGIGMINPPLASTAVGVVEPQRAGMASGINSTFRQVGIATGIALLGTLFSSRTHDQVTSHLDKLPGAAGHSDAIASALKSGDVGSAILQLPPPLRGPVATIAKGAFTNGLNLILLIASIIAIVCGISSLLLIRRKDFQQNRDAAQPQPAGH